MKAYEYIQVVTTTGGKREAEEMARVLVEEKLAACVQILGPIVSTYWWQGQIETSEEWQCLIKSRRACYDRIEKTILAHHAYETPEIIAIPIIAGSAGYLSWLSDNTE